ncbi:MAG: terpene cyclase/mutase family protein [Planctomycetes bacterium]|nr:terpene cyclase/mutase family protein [Planctomycetota bacterium]
MRRLLFVFALATWNVTALCEDSVDVRGVIDDSIRAMRGLQNENGSYGAPDQQPLATALVLQVLGECHEHYTTQDGPFVRAAVEALLAHQLGDGSFAPEEDEQRVAVTAEALLALEAVAKVSDYEPARQKAAAFLGALTPDQLGDSAALVRWALVGRTEKLVHIGSYIEEGETLDTEGAWTKTIGPRLATAQQAALSSLDAQSLKASADRLLALIEIQSVETVRPAAAAELPPLSKRPLPRSSAEVEARLDDALRFLGMAQQDGRFGIGDFADPGITGIALSAVIRSCDRRSLPRPEYVGPGLDWLVSLQKEDGGIYQLGLKNYVTSVAVEALVASGDERFRGPIDRAVAFLKATQLDEGEGYSTEKDPFYGGFGYGSSEKPDLSNTQMALQALHEAGVSQEDEAFKKALAFLNRCQNRPESGAPAITKRDGTVVVAGEDGGAVYRPGDSKAGTETTPGGKTIALSYGSMTYALLKSYLFAGLDPDSPQVQDAVQWISAHYTVEVNPGFRSTQQDAAYQGLYYYYLTLARALQAYGAERVKDAAGVEHDWRAELRDQLFALQAEDGHWINLRSSRWMEGNPVLTTAYALLALNETGWDF